MTSASSASSASSAGNTGKSNGESTWVDSTRALRWALALALALAALGVFSYWLFADQDLACQVVTVTNGATRSSMTTRTCGLPDVTDFIYVLAAIALLLLPDAQRLKIGGFEFERLTAKVEEQTHEIRQLQQTVNTTVNVGSDLINQVRNGFRQTKDILDRVRSFLPQTADIQEQLTAVDQLERRAASESWPDLFAGIMTMHALIDAAAGASAASLLRSSEAADTEENEAMAEEAESVISDYL